MNTGLITIGIFLIVQLIAAVYWAGVQNTKMDFVINSVRDMKGLEAKFSDAIAKFSTKEEVATALSAQEKTLALALALADRERDAVWKQIDLLKTGGPTR